MTEERKAPNLTINLGVRQKKHIVPQRFNEARWPQKFTVLCFLGNKKICHCTRQSSDIQWITDINTCPGSSWPVCYNRVFIHLYLHSVVFFHNLYLMPLAVTEMKRIVYTMLRYQLAAMVLCTEYDLKPSINTLNFSFKIVLRFLLAQIPLLILHN